MRKIVLYRDSRRLYSYQEQNGVYEIQIGPAIGLDGLNGESFVHEIYLRNEGDEHLTNLQLVELHDSNNMLFYSFDGSSYSNSPVLSQLDILQNATLYVKIDVPPGFSGGSYRGQIQLTDGQYELVIYLPYVIVADKTFISQPRQYKIGSVVLPHGFSSDSEQSEIQDNLVESASGNVRAGSDRYVIKGKRIDVTFTDSPSRTRQIIQNAMPDGSIVEVRKGSPNIYVVDGSRGVIHELYPQAHNASTSPNAPQFRRASVAYLSDGTQVRIQEPRIETVSGLTGLLVEEGTTNLLGAYSILDTDSNGDGVANGWQAMGTATGTRSMDSANATFGRTLCQRIERTGGLPSDRFGIRTSSQVTQVTAPHAVSVLVKVASLDPGAKVVLLAEYYDSNAQWISGAARQVNLTAVSDWTWVKIPASTNPNIARLHVYVWIEGGNGVVYVQAVQSENKAYSTSFTASTRSAETLTVPTDGILYGLSAWTIEGWFRFNSLSWIWSQNPSANIIWHMGTRGDGFGGEYEVHVFRNPDNKIGFYAPTTRQQDSDITINDGQLCYLALVYDNGTFRLYVNNQKALDVAAQPLDYAQLGNILRFNKPFQDVRFLNGLLGPQRISRRARTDQEIAAAYAAGPEGLVVDSDTTYLLTTKGNSLVYYHPNVANWLHISPSTNTPIEPILDVAYDGMDLWVLVQGGHLYRVDPTYGIELSRFSVSTSLVSIADYNDFNLIACTSDGKVYTINKGNGTSTLLLDASSTSRQYDSLNFDGRYLWWREKGTDCFVQFLPSSPYTVINRIQTINFDSFSIHRPGEFYIKQGNNLLLFHANRAREYLYKVESEIKSKRGIVNITDDRGVTRKVWVESYNVARSHNRDDTAFRISMNVKEIY